MKKNENIFISLQIQKDLASKKLFFSVQFDKNAPNFSTENDTIIWCPTYDEIDFIAEAFELIRGTECPKKVEEEPQNTTIPSEDITIDYSDRSSEIRSGPLGSDIAIEVTSGLGSSRIRNKENNEKIFIQADEKKIDEILKYKKPVAKKDYVTKSGEKTFIDRMLKQKKKK
jgi:hypothetical protein